METNKPLKVFRPRKRGTYHIIRTNPRYTAINPQVEEGIDISNYRMNIEESQSNSVFEVFDLKRDKLSDFSHPISWTGLIKRPGIPQKKIRNNITNQTPKKKRK